MYFFDFQDHVKIIINYQSNFGQFDHKKSNKSDKLGRREYNASVSIKTSSMFNSSSWFTYVKTVLIYYFSV